ncbi:MAG: Cys-Gln thioester bond-forming surface protein [Clostridia bacterium]|nr:Cys-Gln thioester bond-forming surface protein [Clostridia bacterium]
MKKTIKIISIIIMFAILVQHSVTLANVVKIGETKYLERGDLGFYSIQYWNENYQNWYYITYSQTYYTDDNGERRIAYCNSPDLNGIGWIPGEYEGYDTTIQGELSDERLWRVFKNGYPYVSPEELGVETDDDAYIATKQAAYFIIRGRSEREVYEYFRPGEEAINGQDLEETHRRGQKVIEAIYKLVNIGNNGSETKQGVSIEKVGDISLDEKDSDYSYQKYKLVSHNNEEKIEITNLINAPEESYIANEMGQAENIFYGGESFKLMIPNKNVKNDYDITIEYKSICKNYPVFCAKSLIENTQDYLLSVEKFDDEFSQISLYLDSNKSKFEIVKIDEESKNTIPDVTFNIKYKNGEELGCFKTDNKGKITLKDLAPGKIIVTEIETPEDYILNTTPREYELIYNQTVKVEIDNKEAHPDIEIDKEGPETVKQGEEIKYNFKISNSGNVGLENFTWYDFLPYDKAKITKIATGTFNQDLKYNVYYRTDKSNEYIMIKEKLSTKSNNYIDLDNFNLNSDESIIEIKFEFGDVDVNFKSEEPQNFYLKVKKNLIDEDIIINKTKIDGKYRNTSLTSEDSVNTKIKNEKKEETKTLPRTGF